MAEVKARYRRLRELEARDEKKRKRKGSGVCVFGVVTPLWPATGNVVHQVSVGRQ
jgi:hypothetical protein